MAPNGGYRYEIWPVSAPGLNFTQISDALKLIGTSSNKVAFALKKHENTS